MRPIGMSESENKVVIVGVDNYCSIECCYAYILSCKKSSSLSNPLFRKSETIIHNIYRMCGGKGKLVPAKDWKLLESNGGVLNEVQYRSKSITMEVNGNIEFSKASIEYDVYSK